MEAALQTHNAEHCAPPLSREEVAGIARSVGRYEPAPDAGVHCNDTEDAVARAFVDQHGEDFHICPGLGWMRWTADHWERDDKLTHMSTVREIARDLGAIAKTNSDNRRLASSKFVMGAASLARVDQRIVHGAAEFDREPHELNTPAGVVDFRTSTLRPHRRDLMTKVTAVAPDFTASRAVWHDFLRSIFADDVEIVDFVRRLLGYSITGETREQVLAFFFGTGANGKSTLLDVVMELLGSYAIKLPSDSLMAHHGERHPTDIAQLKGVRLAASNEIDEGEYWAESKLKELTGDRMLTARFMRGDFFTFQATHKHIIAGNHRPQVRAMDDAMRRRILLIPFGVRFEGDRRDNDLPATLRAAGGAILADLCEGAAEWYRIGLAVPASIQRASAEYAEAMDSLGNWIGECCITGEGRDCTASLLYRSYQQWKEARGEKAVSLTRWAEQMGSRGFKKIKSSSVRYTRIDLTAEARHAVEMGVK